MAYTDDIQRTQHESIFILRIDGIPYWFFTRLPTDVPGGVSLWTAPTNVTFQPGLEVPGEFSQSIQPFAATSSMGQMEFRLTDFVIAAGAGAGQYFFTRLFATGRAISDATEYNAFLTEDLDPTETAVDVTTRAGEPAGDFDLYVGTETMRRTAAAALTYTVTRAQYTSYDGTALGMAHSYAEDPDAPPLARVSSFPDAWYNRRVALYETWYDRASNTFGGRTAAGTPVGSGTNYSLVWSGRIARVDFDTPTDQWKLSCTPLLDDVKRKVLSEQPSAELRGIDLRALGQTVGGVAWSFLVASDVPYSSFAIATTYYDSQAAMLAELNEQIAASDLSPDFGVWVAASAADPTRLSFNVYNNLGVSSRFDLRLDGWLAFLLGFADSPQTTLLRSDPLLATTAYRDLFVAPFNAITSLWQRRSSAITLTSTVGFQAAAMGDGSNPAVMLGGKMVVRYAGASTTELTGVTSISTAESNSNLHLGTEYVFTRIDAAETGAGGAVPPQAITVKQVYVTPRTFGDPTANQGIWRQILRLMVSTGYGVNNPTYDVLPPGYGIGIPAALVDVQAFLDMDAMLGGAMSERQWIIDEPTPLSDIIEAECKTCSVYLVLNASGQLSLRPVGDRLASATAVGLTEDNKDSPRDRASLSLSPATVLNRMEMSYDWDFAEAKYRTSLPPIQFPVSQAVYETTRTHTVQNKGLRGYATSSPGGLAERIATLIAMFNDPRPVVGRSVNKQIRGLVTPGDIILLTDSGLPDTRTGNRGVTLREMLVTRVSQNLHTGKGRVELMYDSIHGSVQPLCPSMRVTAFDGGTNTATVAANEFTPATTQDLAYFAVSDRVVVVDGGAATPTAPANVARTITAINLGANTVTLNGTLGGMDPTLIPVYITFGERDVIQASQVALGTWIADSLGADILGAYDAQRYTY